MTVQARDGACAFAWRSYMLLHNDVDENDSRRFALDRYLARLCRSRECDFDMLQMAAVIYLKKLDEFQDDRRASVAADEALDTYIGARKAS